MDFSWKLLRISIPKETFLEMIKSEICVDNQIDYVIGYADWLNVFDDWKKVQKDAMDIE